MLRQLLAGFVLTVLAAFIMRLTGMHPDWEIEHWAVLVAFVTPFTAAVCWLTGLWLKLLTRIWPEEPLEALPADDPETPTSQD
jgi:hypothetical protein